MNFAASNIHPTRANYFAPAQEDFYGLLFSCTNPKGDPTIPECLFSSKLLEDEEKHACFLQTSTDCYFGIFSQEPFKKMVSDLRNYTPEEVIAQYSEQPEGE